MKPRGIYYCLGSLCLLTILFTCCYYISYKMALNHFNSQSIERSEKYAQINHELNVAEAREMDVSDTVPVDISQNLTVKPDTTYILETIDIVTGSKMVTSGNPPGQFIGLSKDEILDFLSAYMEDMTISDFEKGLSAYELTSFSEDSFTIQKIYDSNKIQYKYYVCIVDGLVIVYYSDLKTVYEYTMINAQDLPEQDRVDLSRGIFLKDDAALYSLLEGLSS